MIVVYFDVYLQCYKNRAFTNLYPFLVAIIKMYIAYLWPIETLIYCVPSGLIEWFVYFSFLLLSIEMKTMFFEGCESIIFIIIDTQKESEWSVCVTYLYSPLFTFLLLC